MKMMAMMMMMYVRKWRGGWMMVETRTLWMSERQSGIFVTCQNFSHDTMLMEVFITQPNMRFSYTLDKGWELQMDKTCENTSRGHPLAKVKEWLELKTKTMQLCLAYPTRWLCYALPRGLHGNINEWIRTGIQWGAGGQWRAGTSPNGAPVLCAKFMSWWQTKNDHPTEPTTSGAIPYKLFPGTMELDVNIHRATQTTEYHPRVIW